MKQKIWLVFALVFLIFLIFEIRSTYSLFETDTSTFVDSDLAKWQIKINNNSLNMLTEDSNVFSLGSIEWSNQDHVKDGKAFPGNSGSFYIEIDPTDTDVSFLYNLTIDMSNLNNDAIEIVSIVEENGKSLIRTGRDTYSGIFKLEEIKNSEKHLIKLDIVWNYDDENSVFDYELGQNDNIGILVIIDVVQYNENDEIVEYIEESVDNEIS